MEILLARISMGYVSPYVEQVWEKYAHGARMKCNTQDSSSVVDGRVNERGESVIGNERIQKTSTSGVFGCNSGLFTTGPSPERMNVQSKLQDEISNAEFINF
jgi:hypothetical protein